MKKYISISKSIFLISILAFSCNFLVSCSAKSYEGEKCYYNTKYVATSDNGRYYIFSESRVKLYQEETMVYNFEYHWEFVGDRNYENCIVAKSEIGNSYYIGYFNKYDKTIFYNDNENTFKAEV